WKMARGPAGLETMLLLCRDTPLPTSVDLKTLLARLGPQPLREEAATAVAWFENGCLVRDERQRQPNFRWAPDLEHIIDESSPLEHINSQVQMRVGKYFQ